MKKNGIGVEFRGPLFTLPDRIVQKYGGRMVQKVMEAGEQRLDATLQIRPKGVYLSVGEAAPGRASKGNYRRNIHGRRNGLHAEINDGGVVYGPWLEKGAGRGITRFRGYASFRRVRDWLDKNRPKIIRPVVMDLVRELGGRPV